MVKKILLFVFGIGLLLNRVSYHQYCALNYRYYFKFVVSLRRRSVVGGARVVSGRPAGRSAGRPAGRPGGARRQRRRKTNHLIEAAPFGRLDQM